MQPKPFFKTVNAFRLSPQEVESFNSSFEALHPDKRPDALKELFVNMFRTFVNKAKGGPEAPVNEAKLALTDDVHFTELKQQLEQQLTAESGKPITISSESLLRSLVAYCKSDQAAEYPFPEHVSEWISA